MAGPTTLSIGAQQADFTIAELQTLLHGLGDAVRLAERWRRVAQRKLVEIDAMINGGRR